VADDRAGTRDAHARVIENTPEAWTHRAATATTSYEAAMWSEAGQRRRFDAILRATDPQHDETLLDFGCGTGALSELIPPGVTYRGYDWSQGMIDRARSEHPETPFRHFSTGQSPFQYHVVVAVGPFNLRDGWSQQRTWTVLRNLWPMTVRVMAVSLYQGADPNCIHYSRRDVTAFAGLLPDVGMIEVWKPWPNDVMVVVRRPPQ
jgi:SAM-dependent methyltransferase